MKLIKDILSSEGDSKAVVELTVVKDLGNKQWIVGDHSDATIILDMSKEGAGDLKEGERVRIIKPQALWLILLLQSTLKTKFNTKLNFCSLIGYLLSLWSPLRKLTKNLSGSVASFKGTQIWIIDLNELTKAHSTCCFEFYFTLYSRWGGISTVWHYKVLCLYLDSLRKSTKTWISRSYSAKIVKLEGVALLAPLWESLNSWGTNILILKSCSHFSSFRLLLLILFCPVLILWCHGKSL